jgi:hypothetical protein
VADQSASHALDTCWVAILLIFMLRLLSLLVRIIFLTFKRVLCLPPLALARTPTQMSRTRRDPIAVGPLLIFVDGSGVTP